MQIGNSISEAFDFVAGFGVWEFYFYIEHSFFGVILKWRKQGVLWLRKF